MSKLKGLRETPLDVLRLDPLRRAERAFRDDYIALVEKMARELKPENHGLAVEMANAALDARGYGHIKEQKLAQVKSRLAGLAKAFDGASLTPQAPSGADAMRRFG
ncbi:MAG: hypothetical protein JNK21_00505 [Rhodospirillaceae bacterium]|nr:hypothetical protein [Rhodospirillaceae bacterium]